MKWIATVRKVDVQKEVYEREIRLLGRKFKETMGDSVHILTSVHPDTKLIGRLLSEELKTKVTGLETLEFESLEYLSEENGAQHPTEKRYDGNRENLLRLLLKKGEPVNGLVVVPDYRVYCDITGIFKKQEFRGSGRHRIPSIDEATATLFDLQEKKLSYL